MQRWSMSKVSYLTLGDTVATVPDLVFVPTEATSPEKAEAKADTCANEQGKSTTHQGGLFTLVTLMPILLYRDGCRTG